MAVPQSPSVSHLGSLPLTAISYPESEVPSLPSTRSSKGSRPKSASGLLQNSSKASAKAKTPSRPNSALSRFTGSATKPAVASEKENHPEPPSEPLSEPSGPEVVPQDAKLAKRFENVFRPELPLSCCLKAPLFSWTMLLRRHVCVRARAVKSSSS